MYNLLHFIIVIVYKVKIVTKYIISIRRMDYIDFMKFQCYKNELDIYYKGTHPD